MHPPGERSFDINKGKTITINPIFIPIRAGGRGGPPLRGGFVSMRGISGAVNRFSISSTARTNLPTRRRVECGADVPGAGHFSRRGLQATDHSASIRAGTVVDGQNQQIATNPPRRDHRGWSPHMAASRNKPAKPNPVPNRIFVTPGEIGTWAMHPPGKRSIDIN
jgi:hypothetical protein